MSHMQKMDFVVVIKPNLHLDRRFAMDVEVVFCAADPECIKIVNWIRASDGVHTNFDSKVLIALLAIIVNATHD